MNKSEKGKLVSILNQICSSVEKMSDKEVNEMIIFFEGWKAREKFEEKKGA